MLYSKVPTLKFTSQYYFCPNFFSYDTYIGCTHTCKYCFAYWQQLTNASCVRIDRKMSQIEPANPVSLGRILSDVPITDAEHKLYYAKKLGMPLHIGGLSDPFQPAETEWGITRRTLQTLNHHDYPFVISTKNILAYTYIDFFKQNPKNTLQVSLIGNNDKVRQLEPNASDPERRLDLLEQFDKENVRTVLRLQPFIINLSSNEELENFIRTASEHHVKNLTVEFLKVSKFRNDRIDDLIDEIDVILGTKLINYYRLYSNQGTSDMELNNTIKIPIMLTIKELCRKYNINFYSADNSLRILGDSPNCCGLPEDNSRYMLYQNRLPFLAMRENRPIGFHEFYDFDRYKDNWEILNFKGINPWINTQDNYELFLNSSFLDFIERAWNDLKNPNNPANFFGSLLVDDRVDNYYTYRHNPSWINQVTGQQGLGKFLR